MARPEHFHQRLVQAITDNPVIPEKGRGRAVYRIGRKWVVDRSVLETYFEAKRALSLA